MRPRSVGSFFISRSSERASERAVREQPFDVVAVEVVDGDQVAAGGCWGRQCSCTRERVDVGHAGLLRGREQEHAVDLVDLDELHLDALAACGRQVLADVVGTDGELTVAAVGEHGELDACRAAEVEEPVDRRADGAAGVQHVVDEHDRPALEREVELRVTDERLRVQRRLAARAHVHVVAVKGDVERSEVERLAAEVLDQAPQPLGERHPARVDADERDVRDLVVALDDLVGDPRERPRDRLLVEEQLLGREADLTHRPRAVAGRVMACVIVRLLSGLSGPG